MPKVTYMTSNLRIDKEPLIKKYQRDDNRLGLIDKRQMKNITFRLPVDAIEDIKAISKETSERLNMKITQTNVIEIMARHLRKFPAKLTKMIKA